MILVCTFGYDGYIYRCGEHYQISDGSNHPPGDDAWKIFVNATGHKGNVSDSFNSLIRYIVNEEILLKMFGVCLAQSAHGLRKPTCQYNSDGWFLVLQQKI